jgi:hypothetical protein
MAGHLLGVMQIAANEVRRISIPRNWLNNA